MAPKTVELDKCSCGKHDKGGVKKRREVYRRLERLAESTKKLKEDIQEYSQCGCDEDPVGFMGMEKLISDFHADITGAQKTWPIMEEAHAYYMSTRAKSEEKQFEEVDEEDEDEDDEDDEDYSPSECADGETSSSSSSDDEEDEEDADDEDLSLVEPLDHSEEE